MAEYLGYVNPAETKANPTLDWSTVINDVRDTLVQQEKNREDTRQRARQETNDLYESLTKISSGQNQGLNGFITNASYQSKNLLGEANKLYTSGKISGKEFANIKSNMRGSFTDINDIVKTMQGDYDRYTQLSQKGQTSIIDDYNQKKKGEALDLSNKEFYVDPLTGRGYIGTLKDGKIDPASLQPPAWIKSNGSNLIGKVDIMKEIAPFTKDLAKFEYVLGKNKPAGGIWTADNISEAPGFDKFLTEAINTIASNPYKITDILGQTKGYNLTDDPNETSKERILMQRDSSTGMNTPMLTAQQEKEAKDSIKEAILSQVNKTIRQDEGTYRPPAPGVGRGDYEGKLGKDEFASSIEIPANGKGAFVPMAGVNVKVGASTENIPNWGIDSNGKLFVDVVTGGNDDVMSMLQGGGKSEPTVSKRYSENNVEFKKRLKHLINPNTQRNVSSLAEAKSIFNNIGTKKSKNNDPLGIL